MQTSTQNISITQQGARAGIHFHAPTYREWLANVLAHMEESARHPFLESYLGVLIPVKASPRE